MNVVNPTFLQLLSKPIHLLAFGFGSGLFSRAPGTAGTLVGVLFWFFLVDLPLTSYLTVVLIAALVGIYICGKTATDLATHDHGGIVWDEIVGVLLAMSIIPVTWTWVISSFLLFRLLDIWKPWPISWLDKNIGGGIGIMIDDMLAGAFTLAILYLVVEIL